MDILVPPADGDIVITADNNVGIYEYICSVFSSLICQFDILQLCYQL